MKKHGFTLAEILITLGIIGVISALTIPNFTAGTQNAKIGPQLAKAKADFEQATTALLNEAQVDSLSGAMMCPATKQNCTANERVQIVKSNADFWANLGHYLKGSTMGSNGYMSASGVGYVIVEDMSDSVNSSFPHDGVLTKKFQIDINGYQQPEKAGKDLFYFELRDDGSLVPWGSAAMNVKTTETYSLKGWGEAGSCERHKVPAIPEACAGHIFENGLKAEYK